MAVRLQADIVADVMRNADPKRREAAVASLQSAGVPSQKSFAETVHLSPQANGNIGSMSSSRGTEAYQDFEQVVLRNLFETLLPETASGSFGGGPSAGVWRSMAADQLAFVYARSGGIGIAGMLEPAANHDLRRESEWPYFSLRAADSGRG